MRFSSLLALAGTLAGSLPGRPATAQSSAPATAPITTQPGVPTAGRLRYESTQRITPQNMRITMYDSNGQEINTSGPGSTVELPTSMSSSCSLVYRGAYGKEEQASPPQLAEGNISVVPRANPAPAVRALPPPPTEAQYFSFADRTSTAVATIAGADYALAPAAVPAPPVGWQDLPQTRKIAGYRCHKATAPFKKTTYTLWVTTELPFTYSPVRELTPARGVVLALRSDQEEYLATQLTAEPVAEAAVCPSPQAQPISEAALQELRANTQADLRQRFLDQYARPAAH